MNTQSQVLILILLLVFPVSLMAQTAVIKGVVRNKVTNEPVKNTSLSTDDGSKTLADSSGFFRLVVKPGRRYVKANCVGFAPLEHMVKLAEDDEVNIVLYLDQKINELERVVITSSKHEKQMVREPVSITVIKPYLISNTNANTLSDVMNKVPGVSVIEGQALIRGSTGWSYNVGSRVMVLLDDMPMMGADIGDVQWDLMPMEAAEQIEVIKGPSSVLYGSSASSGTISLRTGWPTNKPETKVTTYQTILNSPQA